MTPVSEPSSIGKPPGPALRPDAAGGVASGPPPRSWLKPRKDWHGKNAIVPQHLCHRLLDIYSWASGAVSFVAAAMVLAQHPRRLIAEPIFWILSGFALLQLTTAVLRGLSFPVRYTVLVFSLLAFSLIATVTVGIGPNFLFFVVMLVTSAELLFGFRAGLMCLLGVFALFSAVAWGWVHGWLPVVLSPAESASILDYHFATVWMRTLTGTAVCVAAVLVLTRYILRSLNAALRESESALSHLSVEQEKRARAMEALRSSEETFSKVFRFSPDAISVADLETGRYIDANEGFERLFGYKRAEIMGRSAGELGHWVRREDRVQLLDALRTHGFVRDFEALGMRRDGEVRLFIVSAQVVEISGRKTLVVSAHDVTEQRRADGALRESEAKFSKVFHASPISITISDLETGRIVDANEAFQRTFECSHEEAVGRTVRELGFWRDSEERDMVVAALRSGGLARNLKVKCRTLRGAQITVLVSYELMELHDRPSMLSMAQDITDSEHAEEERARSLARESQARDEFTHRLIAAQEAERSRIAGELHDSLGQSMLLVKNRAQLSLAGAALPQGLRTQLESIQEIAAQAIAEVRHISHDLRPYQLDQLGLTRALESMIDGAARGAGLLIERRLEQVDDAFTADSAIHFYRIVQESLNNIMKHSRARRVEIRLERDIHQIRLWIEDDGCGFTPGGPTPQGVGLGLKNIAERARILGGALRIESHPGRGSTIELTIGVSEAA